jgi:nicotinamide-nucleotide amidase
VMMSPLEAKLRAVLGESVWGADGDTMEAVAYRLLSEKNLSLAVIEGYSGGQLINTISESGIISPLFKAGLVMGSDEMLQEAGISGSLYADPDVTADAARRRFNADIGICVTDFTPANKQPGETGGTICVGIAYENMKKSVPLSSVRERARARSWIVSAALFELIKILRNLQ